MRRAAVIVPLALCLACKGPLPLKASHPSAPEPAKVEEEVDSAQSSYPATPILAKDEDPTGFDGVRSMGGLRAEGPRRTAPSLVCNADVSDLSTLADSEIPTSWVFDLRENATGGYRLVVRGMLLAEAEVGDCRAYTWIGGLAPDPTGPGSSLVPGAGCDLPKVGAPAWLRAIDMDDWTRDDLGYVEEVTDFDPKTGLSAPRTARRVKAHALWPSVLYAFVEPESFTPAKDLVVIAPAATWVSAQGTIREQENPHVGSFSIVRAPLDEHGGTTIAVDLQASAIAAFRDGPPAYVAPPRERFASIGGDPNAPPEPPAVSVAIEVVDGRVTTSVVELSPNNVVSARMAPFKKASHAASSPVDRSGCRVVASH